MGQRAADLCANLLGSAVERPSLVLGVLAAALGALIGIWLSKRFAPRSNVATFADLAADQAGRATDLASSASSWATRHGRRAQKGAERAAEAVEERLPRDRGVGGQVQAGMALLPLAVRLLSNPLIQGYLRRMLVRRVARTIGR
ncbi:MAG: hypothetical protein H0V51_12600 [Chloroflexi bacterium]|nr:hypothetical protein [Chloroflexota bacterium]